MSKVAPSKQACTLTRSIYAVPLAPTPTHSPPSRVLPAAQPYTARSKARGVCSVRGFENGYITHSLPFALFWLRLFASTSAARSQGVASCC